MDSAGIPWYSTGTVNVTQGSSNVAGVGTNWVNAGLKVGDIFTIDKSRLYQITAINSNTSLSLQEAYQGATGTAQVYFVIRNFAGTMQAQIAAQVSELVNKYESYIDTELKQITGPAGPTSFPYRGTWATGRSYNGLDVVQYGNQLYMALYGHTSTSANAPGATGTAWTQLTFDAAFSATKSELAAIINVGAKNMLQCNAQNTTNQGVTYVVNSDGTVTANGTAANQFSRMPPGTYSAFLYPGRYILSGSPETSNEKYFLHLSKGSLSSPTYVASVGGEYTLNVEQPGNYFVSPAINANYTATNILFSPMIRDAAIEDNVYVPFGLSNADITKKIEEDTGWISDTTHPLFKYLKKHGVVYINSEVNTFSKTSQVETMLTLPPGYRPSTQIDILMNIASQLGRLIIRPNGNVDVYSSSTLTVGAVIIGSGCFPI